MKCERYLIRRFIDRFAVDFNRSDYKQLAMAGLEDLLERGLALEDGRLLVSENGGIYTRFWLPADQPSSPWEIMQMVMRESRHYPVLGGLMDFGVEGVEEMINSSLRMLRVMCRVGTRLVGDVFSGGFIFQHYGPYDLFPQDGTNTHIRHLHLHVRLADRECRFLEHFPRAFTKKNNGVVEVGNSGDLRYGFVWSYLIKDRFKGKVRLSNHGGLHVGNSFPLEKAGFLGELTLVKGVVDYWIDLQRSLFLGSRVFQRFVEREMDSNSAALVYRVVETLRRGGRLYCGPNMVLGLKVDLKRNTGNWFFVPHLLRRRNRHLALVGSTRCCGVKGEDFDVSGELSGVYKDYLLEYKKGGRYES